jgi:hypothetical protein
MARLEDHWFTLDNRRMAMVEDKDLRNLQPLFVIDDRGVMRYDDPLAPAGSAAVAVKFDAQASPSPLSN